jgi:hypothetical protein
VKHRREHEWHVAPGDYSWECSRCGVQMRTCSLAPTLAFTATYSAGVVGTWTFTRPACR